MTSLLRRRAILPVLAAALLLLLFAQTADARMPRATHYRVDGPIALDTNLLSVSGASAWAIDQYLSSTTRLPALGTAFLAAERQYGVNARFLLAAAMHESAWGTSYIARVKHNLFGYNAYDRDPFRYATAFGTFAANIDATAKFIKDFYLTPGGQWWGGAPTLRSMQQFWSSSGRWGESVSRVATSIRLATLNGSGYRFAAPVVGDLLHPGQDATVGLAWSGDPLPAGVSFVATWQPVQLDSDAIAAVGPPEDGDNTVGPADRASPPAGAPAGSSSVGGIDGASSQGGTVDGATASSVRPVAPQPDPTIVAARRSNTSPRTMTLAVAVPQQPGAYVLQVGARDTGGQPLPASQRITIPHLVVRVWADLSADLQLETSLDGQDQIVRVTNTGLQTIPAAAPMPGSTASEPIAATARSVLSVTATSGDSTDPAPMLLLASPLAADLLPGATTTFTVPAIVATTGRPINWLTASLSVLGDPTALAAYAPVGAWFIPGAPPPDAMPAAARGAPVYEGPPAAMPAPVAAPAAMPAPAVVPAASVAPVVVPAVPPAPAASPGNPALATAGPGLADGAAPATFVRAEPLPPAPESATRQTPTRATLAYGERDAAIVYRGSWGSASGAGYLGGGVAWSTAAGASATLTFTGSSIQWIGPRGPTRGLALVLVDGREVARVSLWRASFVSRAVLFSRSFAESGRHTLTIQVLPSPGHPYVALDALVVRT